MMLKKLAWWYTAGFLGIFLICHTLGLTDAGGRRAPRERDVLKGVSKT